jgi:hypothetical protein
MTDLRDGLIEGLRASRDTERTILAALDPTDRDEPAADGGWSARDVQAHLSAWRQRQVERLVALREERDEPALASTETDEINAIFHAERAGWSWDRVAADADATAATLIAEVEAASDATLAIDRVTGSILGNGPEHTLAHLAPIAARVGLGTRVDALAEQVEAIVDRGGWPPRSAAFARYNLACFHALAAGWTPALRLALPDQEESHPRQWTTTFISATRSRPHRRLRSGRRPTQSWRRSTGVARSDDGRVCLTDHGHPAPRS